MRRFERLRGSQVWALCGVDAPLWAALLPPVAFAAAALQLALSPVDPDYWWHVTTGRWMLDHGRIPTTDPFSISHAGGNWYAHEWLTELIFGIGNRIGGYALNIVLTAVVVAAGAWMLGRAARYYGSGTLGALLLVMGGAFFILDNLAVRPQVWGWAIFAWLLCELAGHDAACKRLWRVPLLFVLWINIHLSAEMGAGALALYGAHRLLRWLLARRGAGKHAGFELARLRHTLIVGVLSALALCANPRGPALLWFTRVYANPHAERLKYIGEWQRPQFTGNERYLFIAGGAIVVLLALAMLIRRALWPGMLALVLAAAALRANRYAPLFGLVAVPAVAWLFGRIRGRTATLRPTRVPLALAAALGAVAVVFVGVGAALRGPSQFRRTANAHFGGYPVAAVTYARENTHGGVISEYGWGGYLIYAFYPRARVYMDGREEMYGETFFTRYVATMGAAPGWQQTLAQAGVTAAILDTHEPLAQAMGKDPGWRPVFSDPVATVYVHR